MVYCQPICFRSYFSLFLYCKKDIPYSQTLRLTTICSDNNNFNKRCNKLESLLLEEGYSEKMVRKQVLRAREHSKESQLEKV